MDDSNTLNPISHLGLLNDAQSFSMMRTVPYPPLQNNCLNGMNHSAPLKIFAAHHPFCKLVHWLKIFNKYHFHPQSIKQRLPPASLPAKPSGALETIATLSPLFK